MKPAALWLRSSFGEMMVECRGPVRVWIETGWITTKKFHATLAAIPNFLCDAHRAERLREYREEGQQSVSIVLSKDQEIQPGTRCDDEAGRMVIGKPEDATHADSPFPMGAGSVSGCRGDVKPYQRHFAEMTDTEIVDGFIVGLIHLCDAHLAERKREERAKTAPGEETHRIREKRFITYRAAPPSKVNGDAKCADADRELLGLSERPPERASYWDDLFRSGRELHFREVERVALNDAYPDVLRLKAKAMLEAVANDPARSAWLRKQTAEAVERIDRSYQPGKSSQ